MNRRLCAILLSVVGCSAGAAIAASDPTPKPRTAATAAERLTVPTASSLRPWLVQTPDALTSTLTDPANANVSILARAKVVVRAPARDPIEALAGQTPGAKVALFDAALPEFWIVTLPSVRSAIGFAEACRKDARISEAYLDTKRSQLRSVPTDPDLPQQWYVDNATTPIADLNVIPVWMNNITGAGVTVGIIDEGQNALHPDLAANFNATASQSDLGNGSHATACAGLVAMVADNAIGGAGIAFGAKHSRLYYGFDTDNAAAFLHRNDLNAIKSSSWGPTDNGTIGEIASIEFAAIQSAATAGRAGKGTIIVWAGGNGRQNNNDRADYDQYASNRYAICIGSIDNTDRLASYSESGSSLMVVATSSFDFFGSGGSGIYSTTGFATSGTGDYTASFGGTSAAAPIASGVCALILQANPNLTWRDLQHVLIRTARKVNPADEGWSQNSAGRWINLDYGFGAIDAAAAVTLAQNFTLVGPEQVFTSPVVSPGLAIPDNSFTGVSSSITVPTNLRVERAQVILNAPHTRIGDLRIELVSPSGTSSLFADSRVDFSAGYTAFTFTTVRSWDELSRGTWTLRIKDLTAGAVGTLANWQLKIFGTQPACACDWNASGTLTPQDIFDFLNDWFTGLGDFNADGTAAPQDIFDFLNCWFVGCP